jgi:hypothetical protein
VRAARTLAGAGTAAKAPPSKLRTFFGKYHCRNHELIEWRILAIRQSIPAIRDRAVIEAKSAAVKVIVQLIRILLEGIADLDERIERRRNPIFSSLSRCRAGLALAPRLLSSAFVIAGSVFFFTSPRKRFRALGWTFIAYMLLLTPRPTWSRPSIQSCSPPEPWLPNAGSPTCGVAASSLRTSSQPAPYLRSCCRLSFLRPFTRPARAELRLSSPIAR